MLLIGFFLFFQDFAAFCWFFSIFSCVGARGERGRKNKGNIRKTYEIISLAYSWGDAEVLRLPRSAALRADGWNGVTHFGGQFTAHRDHPLD